MNRIPDKQLCEAWLASAEVPYTTLIPLLSGLNGAQGVFRAFADRDPSVVQSLSADHMKRLQDASRAESLDRLNKVMNAHQIRTVCILDESYPHCLRQISDPPGILFYQGDFRCLQLPRIVSMVGSRSASYAGLKAARSISRQLSEGGVSVVSGLAYGIDSECHRGCMEGKSPTISVMGCGLDITYPERNRDLKRDIIANGGLILSEYAPSVKPLAFHFPVRNRIISGLGSAVILIEAQIRSGSMTTVDHALRQGKEVFVYPGDPVSAYYSGNRSLLRDGARYFTTAQDILQDMNWLDNLSYVGQNIVCPAQARLETAAESAVYHALEKGILSFEQILSVTDLTSSELMSTLTVMQIRKLIDPLPGKKYQIKTDSNC